MKLENSASDKRDASVIAFSSVSVPVRRHPIPWIGGEMDEIESPGELLRRSAAGDTNAFSAFSITILPRLLRFVARRCRELGISSDLAGDLTHDAVLRALRWMKRNPEASIHWGWLRRIAQNLVCDWSRRNQKTKFVDDDELNQTAAPSEVNLREGEMLELYDELVHSDREIIRMILFDGVEISEVAKQMDISVWATYKRYERALDRLSQRVRASDPP